MKKKGPFTKRCPQCGEVMTYVTGYAVTGQKHGIPGQKRTYKCLNPQCPVHLDAEIAFKERDHLALLQRFNADRQRQEREILELSGKLQRLSESVNVVTTIAELRDSQKTLEILIKNLKTFVK